MTLLPVFKTTYRYSGMTLRRIFLAAIIIAFFPMSLTIGKEPVIDKEIVDIDDPQVNVGDFTPLPEPNESATMFATCSLKVCSGK